MQSKLVVIVVVVISVATALAASLVSCTDLEGIPDYYLPVPSYSKFSRDATYKALVKDTRPAGLEAKKMLEQFGRLIASSKKEYERKLYEDMRKLANPRDADCDPRMLNYIFEILTLAKEHPDEPVFSNYVNYIKTYGKAKFNQCLKESDEQFEDIYLSAGNKAAFDEFFIKYFGLKPRPFQSMAEKLYTRAKGVCLSSDNLRVDQTLEVAKNNRFRDYEKGASPQDIVKTFVEDKCKIFERHELRNALQLVHLGKALGAKLPSDFPVEYLKQIEFNRICIAWNKGDKTRPGLEETPDVEGENSVAPRKWYKFIRVPLGNKRASVREE